MIQSTISNSSIGFLILLFTKKFAIHLTEKAERGLCSFLYTPVLKTSHWKYN